MEFIEPVRVSPMGTGAARTPAPIDISANLNKEVATMKYRNWYVCLSIAFQLGLWLVLIPLTIMHESELGTRQVIYAQADNLHVVWRNRKETKWGIIGDLDYIIHNEHGNEHCTINDYLFRYGNGSQLPTLDNTKRTVKLAVRSDFCGDFVLYPFHRHTFLDFLFLSIGGNLAVIFMVWLNSIRSRTRPQISGNGNDCGQTSVPD